MDADASSELTSYMDMFPAAVMGARPVEALNFKGTQIRLAMGKTGGYDARAPLEWLLVNLPKQERVYVQETYSDTMHGRKKRKFKLLKYITEYRLKQKFHCENEYLQDDHFSSTIR